MEEKEIFDVLIIGAGPAGLTAGIYAHRYALKSAVIGQLIGGLASEATEIHNWPGTIAVKGYDLAQKFRESAEAVGVKILQDKVEDITREGNLFFLKTSYSGTLQARSVIFAAGTERRKLNVPGEKEFYGKGVCYCATCDGPLYKNKIIAVVGGGNSGVSAAIYLADLAEKVYLLSDVKELTAEGVLCQRALENKKIEIIKGASVKELRGQLRLEEMVLSDGSVRKIDGIFIEIGLIPPQEIIHKAGLAVDDKGYVMIKNDCSTNIEGMFAAGDVTNGSNGLRQIVTAAAAGAIAANSAQYYLKNK